MRPLRVYLAGGMRGGWQDRVIEACEGLNVEFFDPRSHGLKDEVEYTHWDLEHVNLADCVFAYVEKDNPSGHGMMLELGYCAGMNWWKIFVEEEDDPRTKYFGMARTISNEAVVGLEAGIERLLAWIRSDQY